MYEVFIIAKLKPLIEDRIDHNNKNRTSRQRSLSGGYYFLNSMLRESDYIQQFDLTTFY
jgi:hypothetical protein